ncbi:VanZ family protein [Saccharopolyspora sp. K220]|uniref:VanZ family protein n=1 Tax=Saccharopolyspora soli TaxID=2926618 RepID=UPI001F5A751F|nr:VanZ family protein [Saccharopolyspora soli]MCI2419154.1 VanZ family protein [Saccharopolyspora soli]
MSVLPGSLAALVATAVAALLFAPFVAGEHRRHGELRVGIAVLRFAVLLYAIGLFCYVFLPLPSGATCFAPQWRPFAGLTDSAMLEQFACNIALFVPLGALARRGLPAAALLGSTASLAIELTQLTGIWFVYPCPYRVFDVDDVIANTIGALLGGLFAPLLRRLPSGATGRPAAEPRPVTANRRLLGMCCDVLLLWWLGVVCARAADIGLRLARAAPTRWWEAAALWFAPAVLLLVAALIGNGSSLGQHAVVLRARAPNGRPGAAAVLCRWAVGTGGLALSQGVCQVATGEPNAVLGLLWCTAHAWGVTSTRDRRGISGLLTGLEVIDARRSQRVPTAARSM